MQVPSQRRNHPKATFYSSGSHEHFQFPRAPVGQRVAKVGACSLTSWRSTRCRTISTSSSSSSKMMVKDFEGEATTSAQRLARPLPTGCMCWPLRLQCASSVIMFCVHVVVAGLTDLRAHLPPGESSLVVTAVTGSLSLNILTTKIHTRSTL